MRPSIYSRIAFVRWSNGLVALNSVIELMRDLLRPRHDIWEVAVWEDALASDGRELYLTYQVDNEAIAIPENVDAIRTMCGIESDTMLSIERTDHSLRIVKSLFPKTVPEGAIHAEMGRVLAVAEREFMAEGFKGAEEPAQPAPTAAQRC
jgi:glyceraldehyde-3-phosphate dehydrogenase (NAD(P))